MGKIVVSQSITLNAVRARIADRFWRALPVRFWRALPVRFGPWETVHGWYTRWGKCGIRQQIHWIPVLFGGGCRLFEGLPSRVELEIVRVVDTPEAIHIRR